MNNIDELMKAEQNIIDTMNNHFNQNGSNTFIIKQNGQIQF